jgi:hypothetical protein
MSASDLLYPANCFLLTVDNMQCHAIRGVASRVGPVIGIFERANGFLWCACDTTTLEMRGSSFRIRIEARMYVNTHTKHLKP